MLDGLLYRSYNLRGLSCNYAAGRELFDSRADRDSF